jgi:hypothetical protein
MGWPLLGLSARRAGPLCRIHPGSAGHLGYCAGIRSYKGVRMGQTDVSKLVSPSAHACASRRCQNGLSAVQFG